MTVSQMYTNLIKEKGRSDGRRDARYLLIGACGAQLTPRGELDIGYPKKFGNFSEGVGGGGLLGPPNMHGAGSSLSP